MTRQFAVSQVRLLPSLVKSTGWWAATVPWDVVSDEDLSLFYRQTRASFFRLHSSSIVANRSVTSSSAPSSNGSSVHSAVRSHRGRKSRRGRERGRKSGKRDYHVDAVLPKGGREEGYNRLISPRCLSAQRKCGRNKRPERGRGWHCFRAGDISSSLQAPLNAFASVREILPGARR